MLYQPSYQTRLVTLIIIMTLGLFGQSAFIQGAEITSPNARLIKAAYFGNMREAIKALEDGADINTKNQGANALAIALGGDHFDLAQLLLDRGCNLYNDSRFAAIGVLFARFSSVAYTAQLPSALSDMGAKAYTFLHNLIASGACKHNFFQISTGMYLVPPLGEDISDHAMCDDIYNPLLFIIQRLPTAFIQELLPPLIEHGATLCERDIETAQRQGKLNVLRFLINKDMCIPITRQPEYFNEKYIKEISRTDYIYAGDEALRTLLLLNYPATHAQLKWIFPANMTDASARLDRHFKSTNALFQAILSGQHPQDIMSILRNILQRPEYSWVLNAALTYAAAKSNYKHMPDIIQLLIDHGANPAAIISSQIPLSAFDVLVLQKNLELSPAQLITHKKIEKVLIQAVKRRISALRLAFLRNTQDPVIPDDILQHILQFEEQVKPSITQSQYPASILNTIFNPDKPSHS